MTKDISFVSRLVTPPMSPTISWNPRLMNMSHYNFLCRVCKTLKSFTLRDDSHSNLSEPWKHTHIQTQIFYYTKQIIRTTQHPYGVQKSKLYHSRLLKTKSYHSKKSITIEKKLVSLFSSQFWPFICTNWLHLYRTRNRSHIILIIIKINNQT